jgi:hypothetical protein
MLEDMILPDLFLIPLPVALPRIVTAEPLQ